MYALIDCNCFFASCERVFRPDLRNKPIVVLSNNDGCIVAQSKEVKQLGVPAFVPYFKVKAQLDKHHVEVFSSNYELYADLSMRVMQTIERFGRDISVYSIDEAFLDISGDPSPVKTAHDIKHTIAQNVGLPVCVGIGKTKTLAKLANHIAKKSTKCQGVCHIKNIEPWHKILSKLSVDKVWGIGGKTAKKLSYLNIHSVYDFIQSDPKYLRRQFNVNVERTFKELHGEKCIPFHDDIERPKQIYRTRSFGEKVVDKEGLRGSLAMHVCNAASKARQSNLLVSSLLIFIQTSRYAKKPYSNHAILNIDTPTLDTRKLLHYCDAMLNSLYLPGYEYGKAGVGLIELVDEQQYQMDIFGVHDTNEAKVLMKLLDYNKKRGGSLMLASNLSSPHASWKMKRGAKSASYTTKLSEIPIVRC